MFRLSDKLARLEDRISGRWGKKLDRFFDRRKGKWKFYIPLGLFCWYFYGMLINSVHLGIKSTFNATGDPVGLHLGRQPIPQSAGRLYPHRPGRHGSRLYPFLSHHQKGLHLVFRLQVYPGQTRL